MTLRRRISLLGVLTLTILFGAGITVAVCLRDWPVHHFGVVEEGVLYRSGQPDEAGWKYLRDRCNIRTVIDLREEKPNEPWAVLERTFCDENDIRHIKLPVGPDRLTDRELKTIVETISDPQCQPVLIHCEAGSSRTGIAVAAYRVVAQGWNYQAAFAEYQKFKKNMRPGYAAYLKGLAEGEFWRPAVALAVGFEAQKGYPLKIVAERSNAGTDCRR